MFDSCGFTAIITYFHKFCLLVRRVELERGWDDGEDFLESSKAGRSQRGGGTAIVPASFAGHIKL